MIHKKLLLLSDIQELVVPKGAQFLDVQKQGDAICIWYLFDEREIEKDVRLIRFIGTGHSHIRAKSLKYIATVQDGRFVWHVFEELI